MGEERRGKGGGAREKEKGGGKRKSVENERK